MVDLKPAKRKGLSEDIAERILELIKEKRYLPGQKLPPERELVDILEVSRPSLREAMRSLAFMNVIEIRQGDGTYVSSLEPDLLIEHLDFVFSVDDSSQLKLLEARKLIEPGVAGIAAARITDEALATMQQLLDKAHTQAADIPNYVDLDIAFHRTVVEASQNPLLIRIMHSLSYLDRLSRIKVLTQMTEPIRTQEIRRVYAEHTAILHALEARDPARAQQVMQDHINSIIELVDATLSSVET